MKRKEKFIVAAGLIAITGNYYLVSHGKRPEEHLGESMITVSVVRASSMATSGTTTFGLAIGESSGFPLSRE